MTDSWTGRDVEGHDLMARFPDLGGRVRMLWHSNYWDGPLSGYVTVDGEPGYWVECSKDYWNERPEPATNCCKGTCTCCEWSKYGADLPAFKDATCCPDYKGGDDCCMRIWDRLFLVYKLDDEQHRIKLANHEMFREHVGTHTDYNENGDRHSGKTDHNAENAANGDADGIPLGLGVKPRKNHNLFYKAERPVPPPLREEQVIGFSLRLFP